MNRTYVGSAGAAFVVCTMDKSGFSIRIGL